MNLSEPYETLRKHALASVALLEATHPTQARNQSVFINGYHEPITRDRVVSVLGEEAAAALDAVKLAIAKFHEVTP